MDSKGESQDIQSRSTLPAEDLFSAVMCNNASQIR